ncbi:MAG: hypothetical protein E7602_02025 [Ruminococcaceae bacterium]|nr:hypothetical protein [Oscillospiraceae bacterium]
MLNNAKILLNNGLICASFDYNIKLRKSQIVQKENLKMKRKFIIFMTLVTILCVAFAIGVSATTSNEFGEVEAISNIDLTNMNTDTTSRVVIVDANGEYHTYPAQYVVSNNTKFSYNFKPINDALGTAYNKHSIIRIEVPDNITIATNCGDLSQTNNLVEIKFSPSSELNTLEYGCFYANKKLEKLNIPPKVTTIGTLIINKSTLKELVFMDGFSAVLPKDSFTGAAGVEKVVFSNQMTTVEDRALDGTLGESLKEFRFGASLIDLGTNNMSWVKQSVKFYMPEQFLSKVDSITMETFSWWDSAACLPTGVIFFTGTRAQMEALIEKSTYNRVICSGAELVEWDSSKTDNEYIPTSGWRIVCGYNKCRAFYDNTHEEQVLNGCQFGCARGCGAVEILDNPTHDFARALKDGENDQLNYFANITVYENCVNCKTANGEPVVIAPIFTDMGYSVAMEGDCGIVYSYTVNFEALEKYNELASTKLEYGVVVSVFVGTPLTVEDEQIKTAAGTVYANTSKEKFASVKIKVAGLGDNNLDTSIVCCGYVRDNNDIYYLSDGLSAATATGKTYNGLKTE